MELTEFTLERIQSLYENTVEYNLSDSGVHPYTLRELLSEAEQQALLDIELGYGWTNGAESLRDTIAGWYQDRAKDHVIVTNGSAEANFIMVMSLLNPGDDLIVFVPNYLQIWGWAKGLGINVKEVALREELNWQPDLDDLESVLTDRTRMITICHPNNPTGSVLPTESMQSLVAFAQQHNLWLHADEVYKGSELNGLEPPSFVDMYDKAIITSGLSKAMALPGLRVGWLVGPEDAIYAAWQRKDYTSITTSAVSEYVAELVLQPDRRRAILARSKEILNLNVGMLGSWLQDHSQFYSCVLPRAGGMAFLKYTMDVNSTKLVHAIREERSIMLVPGDAYGMDRYLRLGVGAPTDHVAAGLEQLAAFTSAHYGRAA